MLYTEKPTKPIFTKGHKHKSMIRNKTTGQIAYHALVWDKDLRLVRKQYDYDGKELQRELNENDEVIC